MQRRPDRNAVVLSSDRDRPMRYWCPYPSERFQELLPLASQLPLRVLKKLPAPQPVVRASTSDAWRQGLRLLGRWELETAYWSTRAILRERRRPFKTHPADP